MILGKQGTYGGGQSTHIVGSKPLCQDPQFPFSWLASWIHFNQKSPLPDFWHYPMSQPGRRSQLIFTPSDPGRANIGERIRFSI